MNNSTPTSDAATPKPQLTLLAGNVALTLRPPFLIVRFDGPPCQDILQRLGPPQLFQGRRADHLTIPLEPMKYGPMAGRINVHLTYGTGRNPHRETVARLAPQAIETAFRPMAHALWSYYIRSARRVTVEDLQREGYRVISLSDNAKRWLDERTSPGRWTERVTSRKLARLESHLELCDAQIIEDLRQAGHHQPFTLMRESDGLTVSVGYQPTGLGPDHPPGWYSMPMVTGILSAFDELLPAILGPGFYEALIVIARELQAGIDLDVVLRGLEEARRPSHLNASSSDP